ncbi:MAG: aspartate carbamoyltransferase regulatory subunit [Desulfurococcales archaeon]|nr:aspartate carbamoyltransferase regulatory subunit [Desulfurococcales archaeon]
MSGRVGDEGLVVRKIREGTVIDHIPVGRALSVLRILGVSLHGRHRIAVLINVESRKIGRKDIVKIEGLEPRLEDLDKIALVAPTATVNIVKDYRVIAKRKVEPPREVVGILRCVNPTCITRQEREPVTPRFVRVSVKPLMYRCVYCGSILTEKDIVEQLAGQALD